jgi:Replicative DNA helicase
MSRIEKLQKKFLSYLFYDKRFIASSFGRISQGHLPDYQYIYNILISYYNKFRDVVTDEMIDNMFAKKKLNPSEIIQYKTVISELRTSLIDSQGNFIGSDGEFNAIIDDLEEFKKRKDYIKLAELIVNTNPAECSTEALEEMENKVKQEVTNISSRVGVVKKEGTIKDSAKDRLNNYKNTKNNPEILKAIPTGFSKIDDANGGFRAGELVYVIGRKGDGKSVALLNFGHNAWAAGYNVIIFTLEISKEDYERRFDARAAGVSSNGLKMGKLLEEEEKIYEQYIKNLSEDKVERLNKETGKIELAKCGTVYVVDCPSGCTPAFIESKLDTVEQTLGIKFDVIITDYAGIMKPNIAIAEKRHEQGQIALDQKRIARERECVVISAAQMTREGGKSKEADTSHVAESDQVSDHLDWGIAVRSISESTGKMESFKTRDAAPFSFHFTKKYSQMKIIELEDTLSSWDNIDSIS